MPRLLLALVAALLLRPVTADAQTPTDPAPAPEDVPPPAEPEPEPEPEPRIIYVERPAAERPPHRPPPPGRRTTGPRRLSGPRIGVTYLPPEIVEQINETFGEGTYNPTTGRFDNGGDVISTPIITQFGWQFERPLYQAESGLTAITEWVLLAGGLERGLLLPSTSFIVGVRTPGGFEAGVGPNISLTTVGYALTVGASNSFGDVSVPINAAVVFGREGPRVSLLLGFTFSERFY